MAQSVECPTSAQIMISWFVSSSLASGSVLTAQSLESASDSVSPPLSAPPCSCSASFCLSVLINKQKILKELRRKSTPKFEKTEAYSKTTTEDSAKNATVIIHRLMSLLYVLFF